MRPLFKAVAATVGAALALGMAGCSSSSTSSGPVAAGGDAASEIKLGYFPNVTHAPAIVADKEGYFAKELGGTKLTVSTFNAGPAAIEALKSGAIDATFVGPGPATTAFLNSHGQAIVVVAGAASGGSALVVDPAIASAADLKGKSIATPQLGNTQDIAARHWFKSQGLTTDLQGGGDVHITPTDNAQVVDAFTQHSIAGAWVPEPYVTRLVAAGGKVLVDESTLWPNGKFATTVLAVRPDFLRSHGPTVQALIRGELAALDRIQADPAAAQADVNKVITAVSGKGMKPEVLAQSWKSLSFGVDPIAASINQGAKNAYDVGILKSDPDLKGLVDLTELNKVLTAAGKPTVTS